MSPRKLVFPAAVLALVSVLGLAAAAQTPPQGGAQEPPVQLPPPPVPATQQPETVPPAPLPVTPVPGPVYGAVADTLTVLVDYRPEADINRDIDVAVAEKTRADGRVEHGRLLAAMAASRIEIKTAELKSLAAEISYAKSQKNDLKRAELEGRRKFAEAEKQLLERRRELREREIECSRAARNYQEAQEKACRLELDLAANRRQAGSVSGNLDPGAAAEYNRLQAASLRLEGKVLEARIDRAAKLKDLADQEVKLEKIRRAVYESQMKVTGGGR